ncbi:MAG: AI-2E family transporter [Candidatus Limnocylindrales bacterium]
MTTPTSEANRTRLQLAVLAAFGVLMLIFLSAARGAVVPFIIALLIAYFMTPVVDALERRRVPRWAGILLIYALLVAGAAVALAFLIPRLIHGAIALEGASRALLLQVPAWLTSVGAPPEVVSAASDAVDAILAAGAAVAEGGLIGPLFGLLTSILGVILAFAFAPFFIFYLVVDTRHVVAAFDRGIPPAWRGDVWAVIFIANRAVRKWLKATVIQGLIMGALSGASMLALSVVFGPAFRGTALVIAVVAGLSEFIPLIGPIFPLIGATLVGVTVSPAAAISAFVVFFILQQLEANVVAPRVEGEALALHPALIIAALILGAAAAGLIGALLATVVTSIVLIITRYLFRRASGLIDPPPPPRAPEPIPLDVGPVPGVPRLVAPAPAPPVLERLDAD